MFGLVHNKEKKNLEKMFITVQELSNSAVKASQFYQSHKPQSQKTREVQNPNKYDLKASKVSIAKVQQY